MKKAIVILCLSSLVTVVPTKAFTWGIATHAHFFHELGRRYGYFNLQEIYGAMLPDFFNVMYESPYRLYMWEQTHYQFDKVADKVQEGPLQAFEFGFVGHNGDWGADEIANSGFVGQRIASFPMLDPDGEGTFETQLENFLEPYDLNHGLANRLAFGLAENFVETAIDFLVIQDYRAIALRIFLSAELRSFRIPLVLVRAYAWDLARDSDLSIFEASKVILEAEKAYRDLVRLYGGILMQEEAFDLLVAQGVTLAEAFLRAEIEEDATVPPVPPDLLAKFFQLAINHVGLDEDSDGEPDYATEVRDALEELDERLGDRGFETY